MTIGEFYDGTIEASAVEEQSGYLVLRLKVIVEGEARYNNIFLTGKDGSLKTKVLDHIRTWAKNWDGSDPWELPNAIDGIQVRVKVDEREYNGRMYPNDGIFAPGGNGMVASSDADKAAMRSKWGAKFKAYAGSKPRPVVAAPASAPAPRPSAPAPAVRAATSSMDECFTAFVNGLGHEYKNGAEDNERWFAILESAVPGLSDRQTDGTPEEWGKVRAMI